MCSHARNDTRFEMGNHYIQTKKKVYQDMMKATIKARESCHFTIKVFIFKKIGKINNYFDRIAKPHRNQPKNMKFFLFSFVNIFK